MAKLTLNDITNFQSSAITNINGNNAKIETAMENTLSRNGVAPNEMNAVLDMNSNRIINLPPPISDQEPVRFGDIDYGADNLKIATQPEAEAGEQNNVLMTPLRTSQFFDAQHDNIISDIKETSTSLDNADHVPTPLPGTAIDNGTYDAFGITCVLPSGKVLIFYRQGTEHVGDIGTIKKRESLDGGKTWSTAGTVASNSDLDLRNIGGGVTPSGRIVLAYMKYDPNGMSSSNALITSDDEGATWSAEREITAGVPNSPYGPLVVHLRNVSAGNLGEAVVLNYTVLKSVNS